MLNSGKKNSRFAWQKKIILTLVLSENFFLNETKNHNPSPFKLNGRSLKDIDSLIFNYLWDNKPPKIKREVILQKTNQGGLNITDIHVYTYSKSVKFRWVKKLLDSSFESSWKDIIKLRYHIFNQNFILYSGHRSSLLLGNI